MQLFTSSRHRILQSRDQLIAQSALLSSSVFRRSIFVIFFQFVSPITFALLSLSLDHLQRRHAWQDENPCWEDDPYLIFNPNFLRFQKAKEEEVLASRPQWYAAKRLRENEGISLQPPFDILPEHLRGAPQQGAPQHVHTDNDDYEDYMNTKHADTAVLALQQAATTMHKTI